MVKYCLRGLIHKIISFKYSQVQESECQLEQQSKLELGQDSEYIPR